MYRNIVVLSLLISLMLLLTVSASWATSWSAFEPATFEGIYLTPSVSTGILNYELSLNNSPTVTLSDGTTHDIIWIQAFYLLGQDKVTSFTAENGSVVTDWKWESNSSQGQASGWQSTGNDRIELGETKTFGFSQLDVTGRIIQYGFHIGYTTSSGNVTKFFKGDLPGELNVPPVPEPSSVMGLSVMLLGSVFPLLRRIYAGK